MNVLIFVNYQGNQYEWDNLTEQEKKKMTEKLNQQTADQLGYEKEIIKIDRRTRKRMPAEVEVPTSIRKIILQFHFIPINEK